MRVRTLARGAGGLAALLLIAARAIAAVDPMLDGDFIDPATGEIVELQPDAPWIQAGPDEKLGTDDDQIDFDVVGDVDIVVRVGVSDIGDALPATSPLRDAIPLAISEPAGAGVPIPFIVIATDGAAPPPVGSPVDPSSLEGAPVIVMAFADLDGDGYVGITELDGNEEDSALEETELDPVGRRFAIFRNGRAQGELQVNLAAPALTELRVVVAAAAYAGDTRPDYFGGRVPEGPVVLTRLPFLPRTDPDRVIEGDLPEPADPDGLTGVQIESEFTPSPRDAYGEFFAIATDGSVPSVDIARVRSGAFSAFALSRPASSAASEPIGALRPGQDSQGRQLLEMHYGPWLDSGSAGPVSFRLLPIDRMGNVTELVGPVDSLLVAAEGLLILSPDDDQDPGREVVRIDDAEGAPIELSGSGTLVIESLPEPSAACGQAISLVVVLGLASLARSRRQAQCARVNPASRRQERRVLAS